MLKEAYLRSPEMETLLKHYQETLGPVFKREMDLTPATWSDYNKIVDEYECAEFN
jgi:hypothetical protein